MDMEPPVIRDKNGSYLEVGCGKVIAQRNLCVTIESEAVLLPLRTVNTGSKSATRQDFDDLGR
jgi:hypothetical protein